MAALLDSLSAAARALNAQSAGLAVVGQNIANVNTAGYARRTIDFAAVPPNDRWSAGNGVTVAGIRSARDLMVEARLAQEVSSENEQAALSEGLAAINAAFGSPGKGIDGELSAFFDAFASLADSPVASSSRQGVLTQAASLASAFNGLAATLTDAAADGDARMGVALDEVNALARQIAALNNSIATSGAPGSAQLLQFQDEQVHALERLSGLLEIHTIQREDGGFDVTFGSGKPLVVGATAIPIEREQGGDGRLLLRSQGTDVTSEVTGGQLGGLRQLRDVMVPDYLARLDSLAFTLAERVNALHAGGFDLDGQPGVQFFTTPAGPNGAAAAIAVNPSLLADTRLVAAAGTATIGDNQAARAIAALRDARVLDNGTATFVGAFGDLAHRVGADAASSMELRASCGEVVREMRNLREAVSGVSLDEEAALMLKFQRAYQANARYFQSVDEAIDILMRMVGG